MLAAIILIMVLVSCLFLFYIYKFWQLKKSEHELGLAELSLICRAYDVYLLSRKKYYNARFIDDEAERNKKMDFWKSKYDLSLEYLNHENVKYSEYLTENERSILNHILEQPIYDLI